MDIVLSRQDFAANFKALRERANLTQAELAERLTEITGTHFTGNRISNWEMPSCKAFPAFSWLPAICKALYCLPAELFGMVEPAVTADELKLVRHWRKLDDAGKHTIEAVMDSQLLRISAMAKE